MRQTGNELDARERAVAARETELDAQAAELEATRRQLSETEDAQARQSRSLEAQAAQAAERERELEERRKAVAARELLATRMTSEPTVPSKPGRGFEIDQLERLVAARRAEFPDRAAEWDAYLFELRTRANADGVLPHEVTGLVEDVFAPLL